MGKLEWAKESLKIDEKNAREINLTSSKWIKDSFEKVFKEYKTWSMKVAEKISNLETCIEENFLKIEKQIDDKVENVRRELANNPDDFPLYSPIFDDFRGFHTIQLPIKKQNKIDLSWHDLKQTIEVRLDDISEKMGMPKEIVPWHGVLCGICKIYRDWKTGTKYFPPRFSHEQNQDMIL